MEEADAEAIRALYHGLVGTGKLREEELSSFTPKSPLSMPYIPDELNDPAAYPATHAAFKEAQAKYREKLSKLTPTLNPLLTPS
jgi:hypothetical protein